MGESQETVAIISNVCDLPWIANGVSGMVCKVSDSAVIKYPTFTDKDRSQAAVECAIYQRLGPHPQITKLLSIHDGMIVLERLQYPLRKRLVDLQGIPPTTAEVLRWASQAASGLEYIHSRGVFQVDIGAHNMLLDWDDNVKLVDFAGSSLDGSEPMILCSARSEHPDFPATNPSLRTEIFALGSTLYEIETTRQPYKDKTENEVETLFRAGEFPQTTGLVLGQVIEKCWMMGYNNVSEVLNDIEALKKEHGMVCDRTTTISSQKNETKNKVLTKSHFILSLSFALFIIFLSRSRASANR